jgi:hypothetical protein|tara:strand:- start:958 stop:1398 length:441 start_codon:yes stop_codon:yes gene_type:complete
MDMLAELAIANAAFQVIKQTLSNGGELLSAGKAVGEYFGAEKAIAKQVEAGTGNVLEAFQAKEQLRIQEEELKYMLNKQRLQGYQDFLAFKQQYTRDLREAEKEKARKKYRQQQAIEENITVALKAMGIVLVIMAAAFGVAVYIKV